MGKFVTIKTPIEFYNVSLTAREERALIKSLTKPQKEVLRILYGTPGIMSLKDFNEKVSEKLGRDEKGLNTILAKLQGKMLVHITYDDKETYQKYLLVMPMGMRIMSVIFSKRE